MGSPESKGQHAVPKGSSAWWGGHGETIPLVFQNPENFPSHAPAFSHRRPLSALTRPCPPTDTHVGAHVPLTQIHLPSHQVTSHTDAAWYEGSQTHPGFPREGGGRKLLLFHCSGREHLEGTVRGGQGRKKGEVCSSKCGHGRDSLVPVLDPNH